MKTGYAIAVGLAWSFCHGVLANHIEDKGFVVIEAEHFASQHLDGARRWVVFSKDTPQHKMRDADIAHYHDASNGKYIELLPDTRTNHHEKIVFGKNFTNEPGKVAVLSYPVHFSTPGEYIVWARAYSTGSEDNGIHFGLNGEWPYTGQRLQLCEGKDEWTWSSAQRVPSNHCGKPNTVSLTIPSAGVHNVMLSMREDGFELDKLILTLDKEYQPRGIDKAETTTQPPSLPEKTMLFAINDYKRALMATEDFELKDKGEIPYYIHQEEHALAINAVHQEYRNKYAYAAHTVTAKDVGTYRLTLVTLTEIDGESSYRILHNGVEIAQFTNPETNTDYQEAYFHVDNVELKKGDIIQVASKAVTNGKIPENGGTAFARGRWRALVINRGL